MRRLLAGVAVILFSFPAFAKAQHAPTTADIVRAANAFLSSLTTDQRQKVLYAFDDAEQRARWSNFPTGFVLRGGISLKQMSAPQRDAAMKLLGTVLSPMGLAKVNEIREADDDFKANGSKRGPGGRGDRPPTGPRPGGQNGPPPPFGGPVGSGGPGGTESPAEGRAFRTTICSE